MTEDLITGQDDGDGDDDDGEWVSIADELEAVMEQNKRLLSFQAMLLQELLTLRTFLALKTGSEIVH